jgi:hypothetical protein
MPEMRIARLKTFGTARRHRQPEVELAADDFPEDRPLFLCAAPALT